MKQVRQLELIVRRGFEVFRANTAKVLQLVSREPVRYPWNYEPHAT